MLTCFSVSHLIARFCSLKISEEREESLQFVIPWHVRMMINMNNKFLFLLRYSLAALIIGESNRTEYTSKVLNTSIPSTLTPFVSLISLVWGLNIAAIWRKSEQFLAFCKFLIQLMTPTTLFWKLPSPRINLTLFCYCNLECHFVQKEKQRP